MKMLKKINKGLHYILLLLLWIQEFDCIKITNFQVPRYHAITSYSNPEDVVLDCEYKANRNDTGIEVKWFFNGHPIYQWIPNKSKQPYTNPILRSKIDVSYQASLDPLQKFRAIALRDPTWNLTGKYTCSVSSFESTDRKSAFLQIIDISKGTIQLIYTMDERNIEAECIVRNVFPQPRLNIMVDGEHYLPIKSEKVTQNDDELFDVAVLASFTKEGIHNDDRLVCIMIIPGFNFTRKEIVALSGCRSSIHLAWRQAHITFAVFGVILSKMIFDRQRT